MNLQSGARYGLAGLLGDAIAPGLTGGNTSLGALLLGLFRPSAQDMNRVYQPERTWSTRAMANTNFERREQRVHDAANPGRYAMEGLKMTGLGAIFKMFSRGFQYPTWLAAMNNWSGRGDYIPYNKGGHLVDAWNSGKLKQWGWLAGNFY